MLIAINLYCAMMIATMISHGVFKSKAKKKLAENGYKHVGSPSKWFNADLLDDFAAVLVSLVPILNVEHAVRMQTKFDEEYQKYFNLLQKSDELMVIENIPEEKAPYVADMIRETGYILPGDTSHYNEKENDFTYEANDIISIQEQIAYLEKEKSELFNQEYNYEYLEDQTYKR